MHTAEITLLISVPLTSDSYSNKLVFGDLGLEFYVRTSSSTIMAIWMVDLGWIL